MFTSKARWYIYYNLRIYPSPVYPWCLPCAGPATRPPVSIKLNYPQFSSPARWHFVRPCYTLLHHPLAPSTWQCRCFVRRQSLRSVWAWDSWAAIMFIHDLCKYPQQQQSCSEGINIDSFMKWVTSFEDNHKITNMGILRALGHQFMINW